jgi:hypothetical protein
VLRQGLLSHVTKLRSAILDWVGHEGLLFKPKRGYLLHELAIDTLIEFDR